MQTRLTNLSRPATGARAFSLVELMTAVSITVVIIFALYQMFAQTQKALRSNMTQTDVLEGGRAAAEMIARDLEQISASHLPQIRLVNGVVLPPTANLFVWSTPLAPTMQKDIDEQSTLRTNLLQEVFFLRRNTNSWVGTGYRVVGASNGVGTLFRFTVSTNYRALSYTNLISDFVQALPTDPKTGLPSANFQPVLDGVVHFRVTAYDPNGQRMGWETTNTYPAYKILRMNRAGGIRTLYSSALSVTNAQVVLQQAQAPYASEFYETQYSFSGDALPASVELELGVLEPAALQQLRAMDAGRTAPGASVAAQRFLAKQSGKVHLFRQRIPIRTALP